MGKKAVVLLSGGLDSATAMAVAKDEEFALYALSFDYGQRHSIELAKAKRLAAWFGVRDHLILSLELHKIGGSALTGTKIPLAKGRNLKEITEGIPATYVPARNTVFLAYALAWAEVLGSEDIFIGVNAVDFSGYPDCRPEYISAFEKLANLATKAGAEKKQRFTIHAPLINLTKAAIIRKGVELGVDYALTHSCYDPLPEGVSCGECDSCKIRLKGFSAAGVEDPIRYT
jgi:7-cyano-7-deazaguanine synthase